VDRVQLFICVTPDGILTQIGCNDYYSNGKNPPIPNLWGESFRLVVFIEGIAGLEEISPHRIRGNHEFLLCCSGSLVLLFFENKTPKSGIDERVGAPSPYHISAIIICR